jgi:tRNA(Ile)-lysidine synthase
MLRGGDVVLVAVSGGADSVALLDVLHALAGPLGLTLAAAHVHHGLHPDADAWAAGVRLRCDRLGVPCHVEQVAVKRGPPWEGLEAEARRARHDALARIARATGAARIATGHTAEDQAETVLMRLLQGAGPRGLGGIAPVRGILIRPLIESRRAEIEAHLRARGLPWVEDPSNRDPAMLRNRIRHDLLPFMAELTGGAVVEALGRSAAAARAMVADLESRARADLARLGRRDGAGVVLDVGALRERPVELGAEVLRQAAALQGETRPLRGPAQRALRRVLAETPRRHAARLGRLVVERSGGALRVGPVTVPAVSSRPWPVPGVLELPEIGARLRARVLPRAAGYTVPRDAARAAFDADALPRVLRVRPRRAGDVFAPFGGPGVRRLKSFLIDAGVPRWARPRVPLVEAGSEIVWVAGVRRAALAPVTDTTVRILELALEALP